MYLGAPCPSLLQLFMSFSRSFSVWRKAWAYLTYTRLRAWQPRHGVSLFIQDTTEQEQGCCSMVKKKAWETRPVIDYVNSPKAHAGVIWNTTVDGTSLLLLVQKKELGTWCWDCPTSCSEGLAKLRHLQTHFAYLGPKQQQQQQFTNHKPTRWLKRWEVCQLHVYLCTAFTKITG